MQVELQAHLAFHLTGKRSEGEFDVATGSDLRPALLAGYRDLTSLRYDFPLVLVGGGAHLDAVQSLSGCSMARSRRSRRGPTAIA
jgi:hypothetical protein